WWGRMGSGNGSASYVFCRKNRMKVAIIVGHPRADSYCAALADRYIQGARDAGAQVHYIRLMDLDFERDVLTPKPEAQHLEPDVLRAQEWIRWADHLVFVFPTWWRSVEHTS